MTVCVTGDDVLVRKLPVPAYEAVRLCEPVARGVVRIATPEAFSVRVPRFVAPSKKLTLPPGVPASDVTVAVMVTFCPNVLGFGDVPRLVVVTPLKFAVTLLAALMVMLLGLTVPERSPEKPVKL